MKYESVGRQHVGPLPPPTSVRILHRQRVQRHGAYEKWLPCRVHIQRLGHHSQDSRGWGQGNPLSKNNK